MATRHARTSPPPKIPAPPQTDPRISWDDLRFLEAIDRLGQIRRVGRELGTSVSTVYRRIAFLESLVGARCIETGPSGVGLTDTGRALAAIARDTERALAEAQQKARLAEEEVSGEVSLTTTEGFVPLLTAPLRALSERHPRLAVVLHIADQGPSVRRREVDVALSLVPSPPAVLRGRRLFDIRYGVFGTRKATESVPLRWIVRGPSFSNQAQSAWEKEHAMDVAFRTTSLPATLALVRADAGVAVLPERIALLDGGLVEVDRYRESLSILRRAAWILTHPEIHAAPRVRVLVDAIVEALAQK